MKKGMVVFMKKIRIATVCLACVLLLGANPIQADASNLRLAAGIASLLNEAHQIGPDGDAKIIEIFTPSEFEDICIAKVNDYVNVRSLPNEESEILGKLYNEAAGTLLGEENGWYKISSGSVTGYVKSDYVVVGDEAEELAKKVGKRIATVTTETLRVRKQPGLDAPILGLIPMEEELTALEEVDGWVKVSIEEGDGWVSTDYVKLRTDFVRAESKKEEEARLAKEKAAREAAEKRRRQAAAKAKVQAAIGNGNGSSGGNAVASYACQFVGNPYVYGGTSLTNGADCSGFVMSVYAHFGVKLPHSSSALRNVGYGVSLSEAQPGDIICYSGHVGIYIGNNTIVHASSAATGIKYTSPANYRTVLAVRRIY